MSFNHYRIKREAHTLSRQHTSWSPFTHRWRLAPRRETGGEGILEAQSGEDGGDEIQHAHTSPDSLAFCSLDQEESGDAVLAPQPSATQADGLRNRRETGSDTVNETATTATGGELQKQHWGFKTVQPKVPFTIANQIQRIFQQSSVISLLLLCCPVGFILNYTRGRSAETFALNFVSTIPLNFIGDFAMTEVGLRLGETTADLLCVSTSNLVQFISCIVLLRTNQITILKTSLVGSILANILFFMGLSVICGSFSRKYQYFNRTAAHMSSNLLSLASTSLLIPTASRLLSQASPQDLVKQSRAASFVLILVYVLYVFCEHWTHKDIYSEEAQKVPARKRARPLKDGAVTLGLVNPVGLIAAHGVGGEERRRREMLQYSGGREEVEDDGPQLHFGVAVATFLITTALLYFNIDFSVNSIDALTTDANLSKTFVGLILFPLSNCDYVPIQLAMKDKLSHTVTSTVGKSIQTALLVTPGVILLAWCLGVDEVTLVFDGFEVVSLFTTVLLLNFLIVDAKVHWIQGVLLLADWTLIAVAAFFVHGEAERS